MCLLAACEVALGTMSVYIILGIQCLVTAIAILGIQ